MILLSVLVFLFLVAIFIFFLLLDPFTRPCLILPHLRIAPSIMLLFLLLLMLSCVGLGVFFTLVLHNAKC